MTKCPKYDNNDQNLQKNRNFQEADLAQNLKKTYCNENLLMQLIAAQNIVPRKIDPKSYTDQQYIRIKEQSFDFIESFFNKEYEIDSSNLPLVEDLIYSLKNSCSSKKSLSRINKYLHRLDLIKKEAEKEQQFLNSLNNIQKAAAVLENKKLARSLSPQALLIIRNTLNAAKMDKQAAQRLSNRLDSYARLKYAELKSSKSFDRRNPHHKALEQTFALTHTRITNRMTQPQTSRRAHPRPSAPKTPRPGFFARLHTAAASLSTQISNAADNIRWRLSRFWHKAEKWVAIGATVAASVFLGKIIHKEINYQYIPPVKQNKEVVTQTPPAKQETEKTKDFNKAIAEQEAATTIPTDKVANQTPITGDYYDSALEIHLKSKEKVAALYHKIDSLAKSGAIKFSDGTNTKRYAHAATMYRLIRPNSKENKAFQNLLNGGKEDTGYINALVVKAGAKGQGVKADNNSITTSNFDNAPAQLQAQHLQNLRSR